MSLCFVTGNRDKVREARVILDYDIDQLDIDLPEIQEIDAKVIIQDKLERAFNHHPGPFIVEDTSLYIDGLNGLPGPLIRWFLAALGDAGVYALAKNDSGVTRARARTVIGYAKHANDIEFFEGDVTGRIVAPRGKNGFGWDTIFQPDGHARTFAEMTQQEKQACSMRRVALKKMKHAIEREC